MTLLADPSLGALLDVARGLVFALFVIIAAILVFVILLQEGKGGGLGSAFGGAAADAFGVKAGTVNRFTTYLGAAFLGLALLHAGMSSSGGRVSAVPADSEITLPGAMPGEEGIEEVEEPSGQTPTRNPPEEAPPEEAPPGEATPDDSGTDDEGGEPGS